MASGCIRLRVDGVWNVNGRERPVSNVDTSSCARQKYWTVHSGMCLHLDCIPGVMVLCNCGLRTGINAVEGLWPCFQDL